jgi:hypothetical protein
LFFQSILACSSIFCAFRLSCGGLGYLNVFGARSLFSSGFGECNPLSFPEIVIGCAFQAGRVKEQVFVSAHVNKAKSFVCESFNRAFSHRSVPKKGFIGSECEMRNAQAFPLPDISYQHRPINDAPQRAKLGSFGHLVSVS